MAAQVWSKMVPDTAAVAVPKPLAWDLLVQQMIPVYKVLITTVAGGVAVSLPAAFTAAITGVGEYGVSFSKQTFDPAGGEISIKPGTKTTSGFTVINNGEAYGESVLVVVYWLPA